MQQKTIIWASAQGDKNLFDGLISIIILKCKIGKLLILSLQ